MSIIVGTNIFERAIDAVNYYKRQGYEVKDVYEKMSDEKPP